MCGRYRNPDRSGLVWGIFLIVLGALFLLARLGTLPEFLRDGWWVLLPAAFGVSRIIAAGGAEDLGDGVTWVLMSAWFAVAVSHWHGLGWRESWPLALVAVGAGMITRAIAGIWMPDRPRRTREEKP
jgi:hypothetical protein